MGNYSLFSGEFQAKLLVPTNIQIIIALVYYYPVCSDGLAHWAIEGINDFCVSFITANFRKVRITIFILLVGEPYRPAVLSAFFSRIVQLSTDRAVPTVIDRLSTTCIIF